jgi:vacuolar protein sorting-associated protein VTA1
MDEFKSIQPFMQRAQELSGREPVVSYYCHFYAAKLAIESPVKSPSSQAFLTELLDTLEKVPSLPGNV